MTFPNSLTFFASDEGTTLIADWARQGLSNADMACRIGITLRTFLKWRRKSPGIDAAILRGREWANAAVEGALLKRALGYTALEVSTEETSTGLNTKTSEKHVPGDLSAQMYWLKTRRADIWGEKVASPRNGMLENILEAVKAVE